MYKTRVLPAGSEALREAARLLAAGEVVGIPTETVYGLAANARDARAVQRIFAAKGRPQDNPLIVHLADASEAEAAAGAPLPPGFARLAEAFWPGPLTMVVPRGDGLADEVSAGLSSVGLRVPAHPVARELIERCGFPLAAPSANLSGSPSPTSAAHVLADLGGRIPLVVDGGPCPVGVESTVLSLGEEAVVLRPGFVTAEELADALGAPVRLSRTVTQPLGEGKQPRSPGTKYQHYAPRARLTIASGSFADFQAFLQQHKAPGVWALCFDGEEGKLPLPAISYGSAEDSASQAEGLFAALRRLDEAGAETVYAREPQREGVGLAVYNRLLRAAAFRIQQL